MSTGAVAKGLTATVEHTVTAHDTAEAIGSGDLDVLGTPKLLALAEAASCAAIAAELDPHDSTVGTRMQIEHAKPSAVGTPVRVTATVVHVDGRLVRFDVSAEHADGSVVAHGQVTRVVVDRERFRSRLPPG